MGFTRRDLLKFTGGSAAGLAFTPGALEPVARHGCPVGKLARRSAAGTTAKSTRAIPPARSVRRDAVCARVASAISRSAWRAWPGIRPAAARCARPAWWDIISRSAATARREPLAHGKPVAIERALAAVSAAIAACGPHESVAILDPRPGRAASLVYRRFLAGLPNGVHCVPPDAQPYGPFGIDLENTRAILSFGAPVLDGWLSPGRVLANRSHFQLIQVGGGLFAHRIAGGLVGAAPARRRGGLCRGCGRARYRANPPSRARRGRTTVLIRNQPAIAVGVGAASAQLNTAPGQRRTTRRISSPPRVSPPPPIRRSAGSFRARPADRGIPGIPLPWSLMRRKLVARESGAWWRSRRGSMATPATPIT